MPQPPRIDLAQRDSGLIPSVPATPRRKVPATPRDMTGSSPEKYGCANNHSDAREFIQKFFSDFESALGKQLKQLYEALSIEWCKLKKENELLMGRISISKEQNASIPKSEHYVSEIVPEESQTLEPTFTVELKKPLGLDVEWEELEHLRVSRIKDGGARSYNLTVGPEKQILDGDVFVQINGISGSKAMLDEVKTAAEVLTIVVRRPLQSRENVGEKIKASARSEPSPCRSASKQVATKSSSAAKSAVDAARKSAGTDVAQFSLITVVSEVPRT